MTANQFGLEIGIDGSHAPLAIVFPVKLLNEHDVQPIAVDSVFVALGGTIQTPIPLEHPPGIPGRRAIENDGIAPVRNDPGQTRAINLKDVQLTAMVLIGVEVGQVGEEPPSVPVARQHAVGWR